MNQDAEIQDFAAKCSDKQQQHLPEIWESDHDEAGLALGHQFCWRLQLLGLTGGDMSTYGGQGHGTLISPYPLYPADCPTLTPPRFPVFALALHRTSVIAPATVARSLPSPIPPQAC
ncbi:hypothetical protein PAMP_017778 [Pampus punctatissimus]